MGTWKAGAASQQLLHRPIRPHPTPAPHAPTPPRPCPSHPTPAPHAPTPRSAPPRPCPSRPSPPPSPPPPRRPPPRPVCGGGCGSARCPEASACGPGGRGGCSGCSGCPARSAVPLCGRTPGPGDTCRMSFKVSARDAGCGMRDADAGGSAGRAGYRPAPGGRRAAAGPRVGAHRPEPAGGGGGGEARSWAAPGARVWLRRCGRGPCARCGEGGGAVAGGGRAGRSRSRLPAAAHAEGREGRVRADSGLCPVAPPPPPQGLVGAPRLGALQSSLTSPRYPHISGRQ